MKIYTRGGDKGQTSLIGGSRVAKNDTRVNAYGTVDELNSTLGIVIALIDNQRLKKELQHIQHTLFDCGADLANPLIQSEGVIKKDDVNWLEERIDFYSECVAPLTKFILPGGSLAASQLHFSRTVARRAERMIINLAQEAQISKETTAYVNRLSDYLFAVARYLNKKANIDEPVYDVDLIK